MGSFFGNAWSWIKSQWSKREQYVRMLRELEHQLQELTDFIDANKHRIKDATWEKRIQSARWRIVELERKISYVNGLIDMLS